MSRTVYSMLAIGSMCAGAYAGTPTMEFLPAIPGGPAQFDILSIAEDGSRVTGHVLYNAGTFPPGYASWSASTGFVTSPFNSIINNCSAGYNGGWGHPPGISADGAIFATAIGAGPSNGTTYFPHAVRVTLTGGCQDLGDFPGGHDASSANGISADGTTVVGFSLVGFDFSGGRRAFRWRQSTGMVQLNIFAGADPQLNGSDAAAASANGDVVVGNAAFFDNRPFFPAQSYRACVWRASDATNTPVNLGILDNYVGSKALFVSDDGAVIAGLCLGGPSTVHGRQYEAFRWTQATGIQGLGDLQAEHIGSTPRAMSPDGRYIVGDGFVQDLPSSAPFIWDEEHGLRNVKQILTAAGVDLGLAADRIWRLVDVTDSGIICGYVEHENNKPALGSFIIYLNGKPCSADFNSDSARDVADLFAYINAWLAKTGSADFNDDNRVDVADLFAYINAWLAGC